MFYWWSSVRKRVSPLAKVLLDGSPLLLTALIALCVCVAGSKSTVQSHGRLRCKGE